jgi:hypothetical protein
MVILGDDSFARRGFIGKFHAEAQGRGGRGVAVVLCGSAVSARGMCDDSFARGGGCNRFFFFLY